MPRRKGTGMKECCCALLCIVLMVMLPASVLAEEPSATSSGETAYHTPLAGEAYRTVFMGEQVEIPAQERGHITALTLGGTFYTPKQGNIAGSPMAALYVKRVGERSRTRNIISIFVNDLEYEKSFGTLELVTRFDNYTIPGGQEEIVSNVTQKGTSVEWGNLFASVGPGVRYKVAPFQVDNDLRLQLLGRVGYFYAKKTSDTDPNMVLPNSTMLYGTKLRGRYDGLRRNILELPHKGVAAGFDLDYTHRQNWNDFGMKQASGQTLFSATNTRNYYQASGYLLGATPIPGLSEKNVLLASIYGGGQDTSSNDRYNSFRIGGGPLPGESDDLFRVNYPGTMFNSVLVSNYVMADIEYRREVTFFLYLHTRGTFIWANQAFMGAPSSSNYVRTKGQAITIGVDSGFFWNSELYLAYSWDSGFIRNGAPGSGLILTWNKAF
jgi:hypothetical protein